MKLKPLMFGAILLAGCAGSAAGQRQLDDAAPPAASDEAPAEIAPSEGPGAAKAACRTSRMPAKRRGHIYIASTICVVLLFLAVPIVVLVLLLVINGRVKRILERLEAQSAPPSGLGPTGLHDPNAP